MWKEYKKRFLWTQVFVVIGLFVAWKVMKVDPPRLVMIFLAMELGCVMGAWMGTRINDPSKDDELPLNRR